MHEQNEESSQIDSRKRIHSGGESEEESSKRKYTLVENAPALEGVFKNYNVGLSKSDQRNDIFKVLTQ